MDEVGFALQLMAGLCYAQSFLLVLLRVKRFPLRQEALSGMALLLLLLIKTVLGHSSPLNYTITMLIFYLLFYLLAYPLKGVRQRIYQLFAFFSFLSLNLLLFFQIQTTIYWKLYYFSVMVVLVLPPLARFVAFYYRVNNKLLFLIFANIYLSLLISVLSLLMGTLDFTLGQDLANVSLAFSITLFITESGYLAKSSLQSLAEAILKQDSQIASISSELSLAKKGLEEQERLIAIGLLAGGLVHEFKNILNLISNTAQYGILTEDPSKREQSLKLIQEHVGFSLQSVVRVLNQICGSRQLKATPFSLKEFLTSLVKMLKANYRATEIEISLELETDVKVVTRREDLEQIIINLVRNAACALLKIQAARPKQIEIKLCLQDQRPSIFIRDNAGGIPEEMALNIFKIKDKINLEEEAQTGRGLYLTKLLAVKNRLSISYQAQPEGSLFIIGFEDVLNDDIY